MTRLPTLLVASLLLAAPPAGADELVCGLSQSDVVAVDGLLDDWQGVKGVQLGSGGGDADVLFRCNYDQGALFLAIFVSDERFVRTKANAKGEDHVVFGFSGGARVEVYPSNSEYGAKRKVTTTMGKVEVADSLQPKGWSVELAIPLRRIPGYARGTPTVPFHFEFYDVDSAAQRKVEEVVGTPQRARLSFEEGSEVLNAFLADQKLKRLDLQLDTLAEMDGEPGLERVVWAGRLIGILSDQYSVLQLPVAQKKDVLEVRVVDLAGHKKSLLARWIERGNGGSREVLAVFNMKPGGAMARTFAHEITKQVGPNKLSNAWSIEPTADLMRARAKHKKAKKAARLPGRNAIVIRPGQAVGFTASNWREWPAEDMRPILLPWGEVQEEVWAFQGDEVFGGETAAQANPVHTR